VRWSENKLQPNWESATEYRELDFMTWVKICGITNLEDALTAVEAGADALGFVFYEKSPRNVAPETVREIVGALPIDVEKVGVFLSESADHMESVAGWVGLTAIQLHVDPLRRYQPSPEHGVLSQIRKYVALPASWFFDDDGFRGFAWFNGAENLVSGIFLDSSTSEHPGGTGKTFDWKRAETLVSAIRPRFQVIIAGGLNPANVPEAMRILKPWGVDVSSGVESKPGKKDPEKVRAFVAAVRQAERVA
jgi:phosphoribosylanthranilate isomerase